MCHWLSILDPTNLLLLRKPCIFSNRELIHTTIFEGFVAMVSSKASPTWGDVKTALLDFDRAGLRGLAQDLYAASKDSQAFLHARLGLGHDQLQPFKASISNWICPDLMKNQPISVQKPRRRLRITGKRLGARMGWRSCRYFIAKKHSASLNPVAWKMKTILLL